MTLKTIESPSISPILAALVSLLPHSICCGVPLLMIFLGLSGLSTGWFISRYHLFFTLFGLLALGYGCFVYWRNYHSSACSCRVCGTVSRRCALGLLFLAALVQFGMATYSLRAAWATPTSDEVTALAQGNQFAFKLIGLHCPACAAEMEAKVQNMEGVESASIAPSKAILTLAAPSINADPKIWAGALEALGYCEVRLITPTTTTVETN